MSILLSTDSRQVVHVYWYDFVTTFWWPAHQHFDKISKELKVLFYAGLTFKLTRFEISVIFHCLVWSQDRPYIVLEWGCTIWFFKGEIEALGKNNRELSYVLMLCDVCPASNTTLSQTAALFRWYLNNGHPHPLDRPFEIEMYGFLTI